MNEVKGRTGCGRCNECIYHDMRGYDHYCTKPDNIRKGKEESWVNDGFARGWHGCCVVPEDD